MGKGRDKQPVLQKIEMPKCKGPLIRILHENQIMTEISLETTAVERTELCVRRVGERIYGTDRQVDRVILRQMDRIPLVMAKYPTITEEMTERVNKMTENKYFARPP